jgi:hypothetical protein
VAERRVGALGAQFAVAEDQGDRRLVEQHVQFADGTKNKSGSDDLVTIRATLR